MDLFCSGRGPGRIKEIALRRAWFVLVEMSVSRLNSCEGNLSRANQPPKSTQPGHPFVGKRNKYQPRAVMLCSWEVRTGMACIWWQVKLCDRL